MQWLCQVGEWRVYWGLAVFEGDFCTESRRVARSWGAQVDGFVVIGLTSSRAGSLLQGNAFQIVGVSLLAMAATRCQ
jgi:hypothetical protein